jgi:hypothetical protein
VTHVRDAPAFQLARTELDRAPIRGVVTPETKVCGIVKQKASVETPVFFKFQVICRLCTEADA